MIGLRQAAAGATDTSELKVNGGGRRLRLFGRRQILL